MIFQPNLLLHRHHFLLSSHPFFFASPTPSTPFSGVSWWSKRDKWVNHGDLRSICTATIKPSSQEILERGSPLIRWDEYIKQEWEEEELHKFLELNEITKLIDMIKSMLCSMGDGEITISAYDTAWVALVEDIHGSGAPQFPSSLEWIIENQLEDGSWGDSQLFTAHDRLINTLACVVALKRWNLHPQRCEKGLNSIRENMCKLEDEKDEHMLIGFEVAFPSLIELARKLNLEIPEDSPVLKEIYAKRNLKLKRIPKDMMHSVPTTLLHSLEGMPGLEWEKLLTLQCADGSFLFSPSSTAFALMQTKDESCLKYLNRAVQRFNGGVPNVYPVDLFEHIWSVDRLERLGIARFFQSEIKHCLDYVYRFWTKDGICWARNSLIHDIDDTSMGFRLLRLHQYNVSADAFRHFEKDGNFFCFVGQSTQAVTGMYNLYRASQVSFPGELILDEAKRYSYKFLTDKFESNQIVDKWIITKDLLGEVRYALDVPWYASLPRIETRCYIEQYGADNDVWMGKTLYRMPYINNNEYLELAILDFNNCQVLHQSEWTDMLKWHSECSLQEFGVGRRNLLEAYFLAMACVFEPEKAVERIAWAKTVVLMDAISSHMKNNSIGKRRAFIRAFRNHRYNAAERNHSSSRSLLIAVESTLQHVSMQVMVAHCNDVRHLLQQSWMTWLKMFEEGGDENERRNGGAEHIVRTIVTCSNGFTKCEEDLLSHPDLQCIAQLTNTVCYNLGLLRDAKGYRKGFNDTDLDIDCSTIAMVESNMQQLVQRVLSRSDGLNYELKQTFLTVAKSFYYAACCKQSIIDQHIEKVLFKRVEV